MCIVASGNFPFTKAAQAEIIGDANEVPLAIV